MKRSLLYLLMLLPLSGWAQDTLFTADIQLLSRGEIRNGGMTYDPDDPQSEDKSAFILDRERLILGYKRGWLEAKTTIQHVGTWGHEGAASVNVYEAWAKANANNGLFAQIGRLALRYDDERIIGSDDWVMVPMTHDALRFGYEGHGHRAMPSWPITRTCVPPIRLALTIPMAVVRIRPCTQYGITMMYPKCR